MLDTRELGRRPGSQRRVSRSEPAPADLGIDVLGVPQGSPIALDLRLEAVMEGVLVSGTARVHVEGECSRCLDPVQDDLEVELQELFAYDDDEDDLPAADEDEEVSRLEGDLLDLEPLVRDAVVLSLPFGPLCRDDCPGLCPDCGARLADDPGHDHGEKIDPRWAGLTEVARELDPKLDPRLDPKLDPKLDPVTPSAGSDDATGKDEE